MHLLMRAPGRPMQFTLSPVQAGLSALQAGRHLEAARLLDEAARAEPRHIGVRIGLALARLALGDAAGAEAAIDAALALDPRNIRSLIFKADRLAVSGRARLAGSYYLAALRSADGIPALPADLRPEVERAGRAAAAIAADHEREVMERLRAAGIESPLASPRFSASLDILFGRRRIYVQEPRSYYLPGLAAVEVFDRRSFDWVEAVEAQTDAIRDGLRAELAGEDRFSAYVEGDERPHADAHGMVGNPDWGALYLWRDGAPQPEAQARHPAAVAALAHAPLCDIPGSTPSVLFSRLRPRAAIPPHNGLINVRLICHLPLIVPPGGALRVGSRTCSWVEGELLVFDDTIEHEAWNGPHSDRVILLFDIWRPELSEEERAMVRALLAGFDAADS